MRAIGNGHKLPPHAHVRENADAYLIELDVSDFTERELSLEALGPCITVRGEQLETPEDEGMSFRLHERLEESFRLPDDADLDAINVHYRHGVLAIEVPRRRLEPRAIPIEHRTTSIVNPSAEAC
jgi:HSP20 family molecular chaperone IbpA